MIASLHFMIGKKNAGYGTKKHIDAIHKHGVTQFHRKSFEPIKSLLKK